MNLKHSAPVVVIANEARPRTVINLDMPGPEMDAATDDAPAATEWESAAAASIRRVQTVSGATTDESQWEESAFPTLVRRTSLC